MNPNVKNFIDAAQLDPDLQQKLHQALKKTTAQVAQQAGHQVSEDDLEGVAGGGFFSWISGGFDSIANKVDNAVDSAAHKIAGQF